MGFPTKNTLFITYRFVFIMISGAYQSTVGPAWIPDFGYVSTTEWDPGIQEGCGHTAGVVHTSLQKVRARSSSSTNH